MRASPVPFGKAVFQWFVAEIRIDVAQAIPLEGWARHGNLDVGARRDGTPSVHSRVIEMEGEIA